MGRWVSPGGELPFAFRDAFGCSRSLATFYDGIRVPNYLAAFTAHINTTICSSVFHSFGCESGFMIAFYGTLFDTFNNAVELNLDFVPGL